MGLSESRIPPGKRGGNRRTVNVREVVNGLMYVLSTGCQRQAMRKDMPPRSTVYDYFDLWSWDGTLDRIHDALYTRCREQASREASPTAAIIDSESVKSAEKGGPASIRAVTIHKKIKGKKRNFFETKGLLMHAIVHSADIQDRDGGALLMASLFGAFPFLVKLYADGGYQGPEFQGAMKRILVRLDLRSSTDWVTPTASSSCPSAGWSNAPSPGLPLPQNRQGLGMPQPQGAGLPPPRLRPPHAAKAMQSCMMFRTS